MVPPEFTVLLVGARYRRREVDTFVDRLLASVHGRPAGIAIGRERRVTRSDVLAARFTQVLVGRGYAAHEVDEFLDQAASWLPAQSPGKRRPGLQEALPRGLRSGYDVDEVDAFVEQVMATLENRPGGPPVRVRDVRRVRFTLAQVREGYDAADVRMFLEEAESWLNSADRTRRRTLRPKR